MSNLKKTGLIVGQVVLIVIALQAKTLLTIFSLGVVFIGVFKVLANKNRNGEAHFFAAYLVGLEVFLRMTDTAPVWEFGKYSALIILVPGCFFKMPKTGKKFWWLGILLLPSIMVTEFPSIHEMRTSLSFNLSGPFLLATAAYYFYNQQWTLQTVQKLLFFFLLPVITIGGYLMIQSPALEQMEFSLRSTGGFAGGFGANQVSTILGGGMVVLALGYLGQFALTPYRWVDYGLFFFLSFLGLMTFSRGGMIGAAGAIMLAWISLGTSKAKNKQSSNLLLSLAIILALMGMAWNTLNEASEGKLMLRYQGETVGSYYHGHEQDITTGRMEIYQRELKAFTENVILGIGPGMGKFYKTDEGETIGLAHSEFTRLIGQHGLLGILALGIMILFPLKRYGRLSGFNKAWLAACVGLAFLTMSHSAMRLAMAGFFYGLGFIVILPENHNQQLNEVV